MRWIALLLFAGVFGAPSLAQEPEGALVGTWSAFSGGTNSNEFPSRLMVFRNDGTVCLEGVGGGLYEFEGDQVTLKVKANGQPYDVNVTYVVDVFEPNVIALRFQVDDEPGGGEISYVLTRNANTSKSCP